MFKTSIAKLRKRIIRHWIEQILLTTILLALILNTIALGLYKLGVFKWEGYAVYPLLLLFSFALSLLYTFHRKISFQDALIEMDIRLGLKDRLSTAREYHQSGRRSLFLDRLTLEANSLLESLRGRQIVPRHFSRTHLLISVFTFALILLIFIDWSPRGVEEDRGSMERLKQIGVQLERYAEGIRPDASEAVRDSQKNLSEHMEAVARALQDESISEKKLLKSLDRLMNQSEREKRRLTDKLNEELNLGGLSQIPVLDSLQTGEPTSAEIAQLKKALDDLFDGEVPASISQDLSNLALHNEMTAFFEKTRETLGVPLKEDFGKNGKKSLLAGQATEDSLINQDTVKEGDETSFGSVARPEQRANGEPEEPDNRPTEVGESVFTAGREKAKGEKKAPYDLESPDTPVLKDKGVSGRGDRYSTYARSLPAIGRARLKEDEIIRAYQKELENVMRKEDIPRAYREYIKQYFLSIGLGKEMEENGNTE